MSDLIACPDCSRHVRRSESTCPFCQNAVDFRDVPVRPVPKRRLSRAAQIALGAAFAGSTAIACANEDVAVPVYGGPAGAGGDSAGGTAATGGSDAGSDASGGTTGGSGGDAPVYGAAPAYGAPVAGSGGT